MKGLALAAAIAVAACTDDPAPPSDGAPLATSLPIEVLGAPGVAVAATVDVPHAIAGAPAVVLELTLSNVVAADAAYVSINGGAPIDLAIGFRHPSGGTARGAIALPAGTLRAGSNRLVFAYTRQVPDVSGFRVLAAAFATADARAALVLPTDDPATWTAPSSDAAELAAGRHYFTAVSRDGGPTCATCHADDGADLAYFAFSNHSIIARAEHHLFAPAEARAIASYLRSLQVPAAGRVFDPPFQPGAANHGAAGAGHGAVLADDAALAAAAFPGGVPADLPWDAAASIDGFTLPLPIETPTWLRWLPRRIDPAWFTRDSNLLATAEAGLADPGTIVEARAFMSAAIRIGKEILIADGDHGGRIELLRYAAVKLWDWQRRHGGFDGPDHGFPDGGPAFPYEVGFALFEAAQAGAVPDAMAQTMAWWAAQAAVNPGRGMTTGTRPLDWHDVLLVAEGSGQGPHTIARLHLVGSWEESQGALADDFGTHRGPVRLLAVPLRHVGPAVATTLLRRFLVREAAFIAGGGTLTLEHHAVLREAWERVCAELSPSDRSALRSVAPAEVAADLVACP
jgi:hypothetical protein